MSAMATPLHTRRKHVAALEWGMWLVWKAAWLTGTATAGRAVVGCWRRTTSRRTALLVTVHRLLLRIEFAMGDLFVDGHGRLRQRVPYLIAGVLLLGDLSYLAVR